VSYAKGTSVPVQKTKVEIEKLAQKHGAKDFYSGWNEKEAVIGFTMKNRMVKVTLPIPTREQMSRHGWVPGKEKYEAEIRRRWRVLGLVLKAKLEAIEHGVSDFETEFLGNLVVENGQTMADWAKPQIEELYRSGKGPRLLSSGGGR
jgi:hypothetical protein